MLHHQQHQHNQNHILPGQTIPTEIGYLKGHGCYEQDNKLIATLCGTVERVNKLVTVKPLLARYTGDVGDVVVGRILEVCEREGKSFWKVDVFGILDGRLPLSSVNYGGRRITVMDEHNMRSLFVEGDVISAEVFKVETNGQLILQTRVVKFGRVCTF